MMSFGSQRLELGIKTQPKQKGICPSKLGVASGFLVNGTNQMPRRLTLRACPLKPTAQPGPFSGEASVVGGGHPCGKAQFTFCVSAGWGCASISIQPVGGGQFKPTAFCITQQDGVLNIQLPEGQSSHTAQSCLLSS